MLHFLHADHRRIVERRLINRTYQRGTYYYEIASEYLIQPIQREMQQLALEQERAEAERRAQELQRSEVVGQEPVEQGFAAPVPASEAP